MTKDKIVSQSEDHPMQARAGSEDNATTIINFGRCVFIEVLVILLHIIFTVHVY
jgi:hypothetical protein